MKKLLTILETVAWVFVLAGVGHALTFTDTYDAGHKYMQGRFFGPDDTLEWTFDIADDGFQPLRMEIVEADIALNFSDDGGWIDFFEFAMLDVGLNHFVWEVDSGDTSFLLNSVITLNETGIVDLVLRAAAGDFYFNSATLRVDATPVPNPEPGTMLLFGGGLLCLAILGRKLPMNRKPSEGTHTAEKNQG